MKFRLLLILLLLPAFAWSQDTLDIRSFDYSRADSIALHFPKKKYTSYTQLAGPLTAELGTEHEKFRALFRWVTDNVTYSLGQRSSDPNKVIKNGKAVCAGFSSLLQTMCSSVGIECVVIPGYAKTDASHIDSDFKQTTHAWNTVKLNGQWYLVDVTWAQGYFDMQTRKMVKSFNDYYFLTPPEEFVAKHLPADESWQLLESKISKKEFAKTPVYYSSYFETGVSDLSIMGGSFKWHMKDTLEFRFRSPASIDRASILLGNEKYSRECQLLKQDDYYLVRYKFDRTGNYPMTLYLNGNSITLYRLKLK